MQVIGVAELAQENPSSCYSKFFFLLADSSKTQILRGKGLE